MPRSAAVTRKRILDAAYIEFRRRGYARVGVDEIAAAAKITKRTLYYHFDSKDALLAAMLERQHELAVLASDRILGRTCAPAAPSDRQDVRRPHPMVVATALAGLRLQPRCDRACGPSRASGAHHRQPSQGADRDTTRRHARPRRITRPQQLAREIWLLTEGSMTCILIHRDTRYAEAAKQAALRLMGRPKRKQ